METIENCLSCGKPLKKEVKGNANKKYCDTQCKNTFNNARRMKIDEEMSRINKILKKNFEVLQEALKDERSATMAKEDMYRLGFSFDYYTQAKNDYRYCYSLGYTTAKNEKYILIVRGFDNIVKKI